MLREKSRVLNGVTGLEVIRLNQRRLILIWSAVGLSFALMSVFNEWIMFHWETIRWPVFFVIFLVIRFSRSKKQLRMKSLSEVINEKPWIKIYVILYCSILSLVSIYLVTGRINIVESLNVPILLAITIGSFLPALVIQQIELYKFLGNGNNNSGQQTR